MPARWSSDGAGGDCARAAAEAVRARGGGAVARRARARPDPARVGCAARPDPRRPRRRCRQGRAAGRGGQLRHATVDGFDAYGRAYGRNKRSITLDLASARGRELLLRLAETADLLLENFTPGVLERLVGGPEALLERNPRLVIVRITGWGQTGPRAKQPGFGTLAEAFAGFTYLNGAPDGPPVQAPMSLADTVAGTYAASAALAALWE